MYNIHIDDDVWCFNIVNVKAWICMINILICLSQIKQDNKMS